MLIVQGWQDESVNPGTVERFAKNQPSAVLHLVDDGHALKESLQFIWRETASALNLQTPATRPSLSPDP
jgi:hypothetical protein